MENDKTLNLREKIDAYVKGQLGETDIQELWNEVAKNPALLDDLELEVGVKALLTGQEISSSKKKATLHTLPNWAWHTAAAAVIALVALLQLFRTPTPTELSQFVLKGISPDQIETSDALRSSALGISSADSLLNLGFQAAYTGNNQKALKIFDSIIEQYQQEPYASKAYLNRGIILYNSGDYPNAVVSFNEALSRIEDNRMLTEKAQWFLANAYINTNELEKALKAAGEAYIQNGVFRTQSFRLYQKLNYDLGKIDYENFEEQTEN
mgnify:CR=1 FL=1|tara:strand:- start:246 stop:1046 length:801 start_codon:yes stop_codon:yes gene_type:complete